MTGDPVLVLRAKVSTEFGYTGGFRTTDRPPAR